MIYLYNYAGAPWKAQYWAREVMDRLYSARPDGYCGDEDNGQTSAWYVFSALGFYPVCPASDEYVVGSPLFRKAVVNLENGNKIVLEAPDNSPENRYIGAVQFDGKSYTHNFLRHSDLVKGAGVRFSMRPEPDYTRGTEPGDAPYSFSREVNPPRPVPAAADFLFLPESRNVDNLSIEYARGFCKSAEKRYFCSVVLTIVRLIRTPPHDIYRQNRPTRT